jgi:hypothetical protein
MVIKILILMTTMAFSRGVGSIERLCGTGFQRHFWIIKRTPKNFSMLITMVLLINTVYISDYIVKYCEY